MSLAAPGPLGSGPALHLATAPSDRRTSCSRNSLQRPGPERPAPGPRSGPFPRPSARPAREARPWAAYHRAMDRPRRPAVGSAAADWRASPPRAEQPSPTPRQPLARTYCRTSFRRALVRRNWSTSRQARGREAGRPRASAAPAGLEAAQAGPGRMRLCPKAGRTRCTVLIQTAPGTSKSGTSPCLRPRPQAPQQPEAAQPRMAEIQQGARRPCRT